MQKKILIIEDNPGIRMSVTDELETEGNTTPVIMLTVKNREIDKVLGVELGADDYVTKPFSVSELLARVKTIFRRIEEYSGEPGSCSIGETSIDFRRYEATRRGKKIDITPLEFQLLHFLVKNRGIVVTRDQMLDHVWGTRIWSLICVPLTAM
jgi:two-component system alkaline phosphatase synthesis response regulator PhoP